MMAGILKESAIIFQVGMPMTAAGSKAQADDILQGRTTPVHQILHATSAMAIYD